MTSRGRGRGAAPGAVKIKGPNLALAGKKEDKVETKDGKTRGKPYTPRGPGRGGRGGRGGGRGGHKPALIQSEGIFSEGLATIETKKQRASPVSFRRDETERVANVGVNSARTKFEGYDALWACDDEEENAELMSLCSPGIIADLKKGSVLPVILPRHDEIQFIDLLPTMVKEEILSDGEEDRQEALREMEHDRDRLRKSVQVLRLEESSVNPTVKYSKKAADVIRRLHQHGTEEMILLQLPTVLETLTLNQKKEGEEEEEEMEEQVVVKQEPGLAPLSSSLPQSSSQSSNPIGGDNTKRESAKLPKGKTIGKLRVTRQGKVYLDVNGQTIDITYTTHGSMQEGIVSIESSVAAQQTPMSGGIFAMSAAQKARENAAKGNNAIYYCGDVRHHMTGSLDWERLRQSSSDQQKSVEKEECAEKERNEGECVEKGEAKRLQTEVKRLEDDTQELLAGILKMAEKE